jgi:hypothetical protein
MESSIFATEWGYQMMERSLSQERTYWDDKIGEVMRDIQRDKELMEEFRKLHNRIHEVEPISPLAGVTQREVLQFCLRRKDQIEEGIEKKDDELERLKANRP